MVSDAVCLHYSVSVAFINLSALRSSNKLKTSFTYVVSFEAVTTWRMCVV